MPLGAGLPAEVGSGLMPAEEEGVRVANPLLEGVRVRV
jgi:hypothetical protein